MQIKKLIHSILEMNDLSWKLMKLTLIMSCAIVFCTLAILIDTGDLNMDTYHTFLIAKELASAPAGLFLIAGIGTIMLEDRSKRQPPKK